MVIGVTGGVGAGKSTVLKVLEKKYHAHLIMADDVAKELMEPGGASYEAVVKEFGEEILTAPEGAAVDCAKAEETTAKTDTAGEAAGAGSADACVNAGTSDAIKPGRPIDRKKLSEIIFQDDEKLAKVNALVHPLVKEEILSRIRRFYEQDPNALIVVEAALLIEAGYEDLLDSLWIIYVEREVRIGRLMRDRGYTREKTLSIMDNQLSDEEFQAHADYVINNSGTPEETEKQVDAFFEA